VVLPGPIRRGDPHFSRSVLKDTLHRPKDHPGRDPAIAGRPPWHRGVCPVRAWQIRRSTAGPWHSSAATDTSTTCGSHCGTARRSSSQSVATRGGTSPSRGPMPLRVV
jgi:hypothetical protein